MPSRSPSVYAPRAARSAPVDLDEPDQGPVGERQPAAQVGALQREGHRAAIAIDRPLKRAALRIEGDVDGAHEQLTPIDQLIGVNPVVWRTGRADPIDHMLIVAWRRLHLAQ